MMIGSSAVSGRACLGTQINWKTSFWLARWKCSQSKRQRGNSSKLKLLQLLSCTSITQAYLGIKKRRFQCNKWKVKAFLNSEHREIEISHGELHRKLMNVSNIRLYISEKGKRELPETAPVSLQEQPIQTFSSVNHRVLIWLLVCRFDHKTFQKCAEVSLRFLPFLLFIYLTHSEAWAGMRFWRYDNLTQGRVVA